MLCMLLGVGNAWAEDVTLKYSGTTTTNMVAGNNAASLGVDANDWNVEAIKGTGSNLPGLNKDGSIRLYVNGNGFTVTSLNENITIQSIAITFTGANYSNATVLVNGDEVTASDGVYEIGASSFTIKNNQLTGGSQVRISSIVMTYTTGGTPTVATPVFNPEGGIYAEAQSVTISCSTEGAAIQYSTDGNTWNDYSAAISVSETTTIQAKTNTEGMNESAVASATYTIELPSSIADVRTQGTGAVFTKGVVTSCVGVTGYIQDATAAICVYGTSLTVGDEITVSGTLTTYKGLLEITSPSVTVLSHNNTVTPTIMTIADINATNAPQGKYVKIVEAIVTAIDGQNTTIEQDGASIVVRGISSDVEYAVGDALTLEGNIGCFDVVQIANPQNVVVQKSEKQEAGLAYETTEYTINLGESFTAPTLTNPNNLAVTYESSNTELATVDENGAVTVVVGATGTTTITASFAGNDTYLPGSASYTLTVVDPNAPGASADNPYTVAQARAAIDAGTGVTGVYATGIVSKIVTAYNATYGNITYNISADGSEEGDQLQAYRGFSYNGENFNSADDIQVGDVVVIYGNLTKHNTTYEFGAGNQLVSLNRPVNTDPVINAEDVTLAYDATSGEIAYTISNVDEGTELDDATPNADWISGITIASDKVTFTTTANEGTEDRTATITLTYGDVTKDVTVTQSHYVAPVIDYATLPFEFDGGRADIETTDGLTQEGLDSDYGSSPKLKFNSTNDVVILHFNEQPGTLTFDIKGNSFSGSTFKVQTSADGVNYTDLKSYTTLGNTQSEIIEDIDATVRYIKWIYTEKVSGNVALGNITLAKYTNKQDATVSFKKDGEAITTLEASLNAEIEVAVECSVEGAELNITSSNSRVAKYEDGVVKALAEGEATITATFAGNENYKAATATLVVTVVDNRQDVTLAFNDIPAEININETATYAVTATPAVEGVTYSSSAPAVVSVDENTGEIEALAVGTATITATFAGNNSYKAATATYTIKVVNPDFVASKYELVTDASTLVAGDEIVFGYIGTYTTSGTEYETAQVMSTEYNSTNKIYGALDMISHNNDNIIEIQDGTAIITLGGSIGAWTFQMPDGKYLVSNGRAKNEDGTNLPSKNENIIETTEDNTDTHAQATIAIDGEGNATVLFQGGNGANNLCYNVNNGKNQRFSCYVTAQTGLQIYKKVSSSEFLKGDVNNDNQVSIADVTALVNIILGKATPETNPEYNFEAANVNEDDTVSIADVTALVNIILGKE